MNSDPSHTQSLTGVIAAIMPTILGAAMFISGYLRLMLDKSNK